MGKPVKYNRLISQIQNQSLSNIIIKMKIKALVLLAILTIHITAETVSLSDLRKATATPACTEEGNCSQTKTFAGESDFKDFTDKYAQRPVQQFFIRPSVQPQAMEMSSQTRRSAPVNPNRDFSTTNNQQVDVDQADIIKTDGTYIYSVSNNKISIVHAYPVRVARVLSNIYVDSNKYIQGLFIWKNVLAVFGSENGNTFVLIYNVANRNNPVLRNTFSIFGYYFEGRMLDNGFMYLISKSPIYYYSGLPWYNTGNGQINFLWNWVYWYPSWAYQSPAFINIIAFDLNNPLSSFSARCFIGENANTLYMSEQNIYLVRNTYQTVDRTMISKIVVNRRYIRPIAFATVRGSYNNQFSFSEFRGNLRVATTNLNANPTSSNVYVLGAYLQLLGQVNNIAPTQRIFSCRYVNRRLYMVTFRRVDPFFVIDLSNPSQPRILGELKIPGFSTYLQPYDENTIIGIGRDADANGRSLGLKIGIFNVTDALNPTQTDYFALSEHYAYSSAEYEHKAFLLAPNKNLLVIPGEYYNNDDPFAGAFAFYISPNEIKFQSLIDHLNGGSLNDFWKNRVERSIYIQNLLYTKSLCKIIVTDLSNYSNVKTIPLDC